MKNFIIRLPFLAMFILVLTLSGCKKDTKTNANDSTNTQDANQMSNTMDVTSDDAGAMAGQVVTMAGKTQSGGAWYMLCGQSVVDTGNGNTITITYDGTTTCNGVIRSGTVVITKPGSTAWATAGAVVDVAVNNLKVTDAVSGKYLTINGNYTVTNETGGLAWTLWWNAAPGTVVKQREKSSNMSVVFSDGTTGSWNVDRTRTWSLSNTGNVITFSVSTEASNDEDTWGTNRYGESFNTNIAQTISADNANSSCLWLPFQGKYVYNVPSRNASASILFGTNSSGTQVGTTTTCAPGYYLSYTLSTYNYTLNLFLNYW